MSIAPVPWVRARLCCPAGSSCVSRARRNGDSPAPSLRRAPTRMTAVRAAVACWTTDVQGRGDPVRRPQVYAVAAFNRGVAEWLQRLPTVWVEGEVTELRRNERWQSVFFTLKDPNDGACLGVTMARSRFDALRLDLTDGERVHVFGRPELFEARGDFRMRALSIERFGLGDHLAALERLKKKLAAEGVFERKRPLPFLPRKTVDRHGQRRCGEEGRPRHDHARFRQLASSSPRLSPGAARRERDDRGSTSGRRRARGGRHRSVARRRSFEDLSRQRKSSWRDRGVRCLSSPPSVTNRQPLWTSLRMPARRRHTAARSSSDAYELVARLDRSRSGLARGAGRWSSVAGRCART